MQRCYDIDKNLIKHDGRFDISAAANLITGMAREHREECTKLKQVIKGQLLKIRKLESR